MVFDTSCTEERIASSHATFQVVTLTKTCRSLEGEREELMNELAATLELVERLKSTLEEQGASYSELQRSADSRSFELTRQACVHPLPSLPPHLSCSKSA